MAEGARPQATTVLDGVRAVRDGYRFLRSDRSTWLWALVPVLVFASLTATLTYLGHRGLAGLLDAGFGGNDAWYAVAGHWVLQLVSAVAALVVALWGALILSPLLSSPALERLVRKQSEALGATVHSPLTLLEEIRCGLRAQLFALRWLLPASALLWLGELIFPPLFILTVPLKLLLSALSVAWGLLDYPMTLAGYPPKRRLHIFTQHRRAVFGFGVCLALALLVPFAGLLMLPVGVTAATRLMAAFQRSPEERL